SFSFIMAAFLWSIMRPALIIGILAALISLTPIFGRTDAIARNTGATRVTHSRDHTLVATLSSRGLLGEKTLKSQPGPNSIEPPKKAEVDETVVRNSQTGQELMRVKSWNENLDGNILHIEVTTMPTRQYQIAFWLFPPDGDGCKIFGLTMYGPAGKPLKSSFWRNDPGLKLAGGAAFPADLYPNAIPGIAFLRTLPTPRPGAAGVLNQQLTPYSYVSQDVSAISKQNVSVPAGKFSALRVDAQARVQSLLPSWPGFVLHIVQPFVPKSTLYFESAPPYRLLKREGATSLGGPETESELVRYYIAGAKPANSTASAGPAGNPAHRGGISANSSGAGAVSPVTFHGNGQ
ncbi:MAG: hypothetical protein ACREP6_15540, partial [Candidatus Binataceae bacterium]